MSQTNEAGDADDVFNFETSIEYGPDRFAGLREVPRMGYIAYINLPDGHPIREAVWTFLTEWYDDDTRTEMAGTVGGVFFKIAASRTDLTLKEATALVLAENPELTWADAADLMEIAEGTFKGKMGNEVRPKVERATATMAFADTLDGEWTDE